MESDALSHRTGHLKARGLRRKRLGGGELASKGGDAKLGINFGGESMLFGVFRLRTGVLKGRTPRREMIMNNRGGVLGENYQAGRMESFHV